MISIPVAPSIALVTLGIVIALVSIVQGLSVCLVRRRISPSTLAFVTAVAFAGAVFPNENIFGLTQVIDTIVPSYRILLRDFCFSVQRNASIGFEVEKRFDFSDTFFELFQRKNSHVKWWDLAEAVRQDLRDRKTNHSFFSSKVSLWRVFRDTRLPIPRTLAAFDASELLESTDPRLNASLSTTERNRAFQSPPLWSAAGREKVCAMVRGERRVLLLKPAHCVQAFGRTVFTSNPGDCDPRIFDHISRILEERALDAAFHMHFYGPTSVQPGVVIQGLWESPRPLVPRIINWITGDVSVHELKVFVIWGKTFVIHTRGIPSVKYFLPDGRAETTANAPVHQFFEMHGRRLMRIAEAIARASGITALRVDFFVHPYDATTWALNEIEVMQGEHYDSPPELDECMTKLWSDPFLARTKKEHPPLPVSSHHDPHFFKIVDRTDDELVRDIRRAVENMSFL